jgi:hypothetical protein
VTVELPARHVLEKKLDQALQDADHQRVLDSLETVVVKTLLSTEGLSVSDEFVPSQNTVAGWLEWAYRSSRMP